MSASERLKALDESMTPEMRSGRIVVGPENLEANRVLIDALPELIAVVEAAEIFWSDDVVDGMKATENLDRALTALDAKLSVT